MKTKYYVVLVECGNDPELFGPFDRAGHRDNKAKVLRNSNEDNVCFALDIDKDGIPKIEAYSAGFMEDEDDEV